MDEPARRVRSVASKRVRFYFYHPFRAKNAEIRVKFVCDVDGKYEKILDFRIGPKIGLIRCSKGDKLQVKVEILPCMMNLYMYIHVQCSSKLKFHIHVERVADLRTFLACSTLLAPALR